jgi:hypothetical protein
MATEGFKRKLTAIFSADVAGYSHLMGEDEAATVTTVETYRRVISDLIRQHRGRVVDSPGDNILAEFASVVDAVQCLALWQFAFRPTPPPVEKASKEKMALPLPDKPSIAVLPFTNMTGDQKQDFFCDGLSESLITALSKVPELFVIARESTFSYKGKGAKIRQASDEMSKHAPIEVFPSIRGCVGHDCE